MARAVKQEYIADPRDDGVGKAWVSTVRLSVDHGYNGVPKWFETYIFPALDDESGVASWSEIWGDRYTTEDQAIEGHESVMAQLRSGEWPSD